VLVGRTVDVVAAAAAAASSAHWEDQGQDLLHRPSFAGDASSYSSFAAVVAAVAADETAGVASSWPCQDKVAAAAAVASYW